MIEVIMEMGRFYLMLVWIIVCMLIACCVGFWVIGATVFVVLGIPGLIISVLEKITGISFENITDL